MIRLKVSLKVAPSQATDKLNKTRIWREHLSHLNESEIGVPSRAARLGWWPERGLRPRGYFEEE
jgi:hypothetical protein